MMESGGKVEDRGMIEAIGMMEAGGKVEDRGMIEAIGMMGTKRMMRKPKELWRLEERWRIE
jgi:hypothetical protein